MRSITCISIALVVTLTILTFQSSPAFAQNDLCQIVNNNRTALIAKREQINRETNPLKQSNLYQERNQLVQKVQNDLEKYFKGNLEFNNYSGVVSEMSFNSSHGPSLVFGVTLPCKLTITFFLIDPDPAYRPHYAQFTDWSPLTKWRPFLETINIGDKVTVSGKFHFGNRCQLPFGNIYLSDIYDMMLYCGVMKDVKKGT